MLILLSLVAGCSRPAPSSAERSIIDDSGQRVSLPARPRRVVSLAPNLTEIVFFARAGSRLVGTDDFSDEPRGAARLPHVGGVEPSVERIVSLRPDLVLASASANTDSPRSGLARLGVPLLVVRTDRITEVERAIAQIASLLDGDRGAAARFATMIAAQRRTRLRRPRVLFIAALEPTYVAGRETFVDDLFQLVGADNAISLRGWPQLGFEAIVASPPDIILVPDRSIPRSRLEKVFASDDRWKVVPAVRSGSWASVSENVFTRPGPRLVEAAAELSRIIDRWERK